MSPHRCTHLNVALGAIAAFLMVACAGGQLLRTAEETKQAAAVAPAVVKADSFDAYDGARVAPGTPFKAIVDPVGVDGVRVVISVTKVAWREVSLFDTSDDGDTPKEADVTLIVQHGDTFHTLKIRTGESAEAAGCRIHVHEAGEEYFEGTARWVPWARLQVDPVRP